MALYRVNFQGTLHGAETFQHGHGVSTADSAAGLASDAAAQWLTILAVSAFSTLYHTGVQWTQVTVSELGASPSLPVVTSSVVPIGDGGTSSTASLPNQISPVVSLTSATAGSRARGRMYMPPTTVDTLTVTGRFDATDQATFADNVEDYFDAMTGAGHSHVVISGVGGVWTTYPLISIRVGSVFDTQRGRRNSLAETYAVRTV